LAISFGPINSGLPKDIVQQIMKAERIPIDKMQERKAKQENKKMLVEELIGHVEKIKAEATKSKGERSLRELAVNTSDQAIGVTVDKNVAEPGNYSIEVSQLAQKSSAMTNGVEDKDNTYLGVGYIEYELSNGESGEIYVDSENSSLEGIAKLINKDTSNGMHATVVNDGSGSDEPWRLIISLKDTGDANRAEFPYLYFVDGEVDLYFDKERAAKDAKVKLDGFPIEIASNKTSDLIPGVTLDLKRAKPGEEISIEIKEDTEKMTVKIEELIKAINDALNFINQQNSLDENSDTTQTLGGDSLLTTVESRIRTAIFNPIMTDFGASRASNIGISFQRNGTIALDQNKIQAALNTNYNKVVQTLTGRFVPGGGKSNGLLENLVEAADVLLTRPYGALRNRVKGIESNIKRIDQRIDNKERMLEKKEENLKQKFARLEETVSRIQTQGAGLASLGGAPS
jgi:flagellar hook-associated protein 2